MLRQCCMAPPLPFPLLGPCLLLGLLALASQAVPGLAQSTILPVQAAAVCACYQEWGVDAASSLDCANLGADFYCDTLDGLLCDAQGNVVDLNYGTGLGYSLYGTIPTQITALSALTHLELSYNSLYGTLFPDFTNLISLQYLRWRSNNLEGPIPSGLGGLPLISLDFSFNSFSGEIPDDFSELHTLTYIDLSQNSLDGTVSMFTTLNTLQYLWLGGNTLNGTIPASLSSLHQLVLMDLSSNGFTGPIPADLTNLNSLTFLSLGVNSLTGIIPTVFSNFANLVRLELDDNYLYGNASVVPFLVSLTYLDLSHNWLSGPLPNQPASIQQFWLNDNYFVGSDQPLFANDQTAICYLDPAVAQYGSVQGNCLQHICSTCVGDAEAQRDLAVDCAYFCNALDSKGPCQGQGNCFFSGVNLVPTCDNQLNPPPPPSLPPGTSETTGFTVSGLYTKIFFNPGNRYITAGLSFDDLVGARWTIPSSALWKYSLPPPLNQSLCSACWAVAAADAVSSAATIAQNPKSNVTVGTLSPQQILDCTTNGTIDACLGGWPSTALDYIASVSTATLTDYPYRGNANSALCHNNTKPPTAYVMMYEGVSFSGWFGLLLTLRSQPAIVTLQGSYPTFQSYGGGFYQDGDCYQGNLDHAVLVVGYNLASPVPYWVLRNSWGTTWGENGYMRMSISGTDGICGIYVLPALYPIVAPLVSDPCYQKSYMQSLGYYGLTIPSMNPCGGGACTPFPAWGPFGYQCSCPDGTVAVMNSFVNNNAYFKGSLTQSCVPVDACGLFAYNPCTVGSCINDGKGSYYCLCPANVQSTALSDGTTTCMTPLAVSLTGARSYTVQEKDTCTSISATFQLTLAQFQALNPTVDCSQLTYGTVVNVTNPNAINCTAFYTITKADVTCSAVAARLNPLNVTGALNATTLAAANPGLDCSNLVPYKGFQMCLDTDSQGWQAPPPCNNQYQLRSTETCDSVLKQYSSKPGGDKFPINFFKWNPGLNCDSINPDTSTPSPGLTVCLGVNNVGAAKCPGPMVLLSAATSGTCSLIVNNRRANPHFSSAATIAAVGNCIKVTHPLAKCPALPVNVLVCSCNA